MKIIILFLSVFFLFQAPLEAFIFDNAKALFFHSRSGKFDIEVEGLSYRNAAIFMSLNEDRLDILDLLNDGEVYGVSIGIRYFLGESKEGWFLSSGLSAREKGKSKRGFGELGIRKHLTPKTFLQGNYSVELLDKNNNWQMESTIKLYLGYNFYI